MTAPIPYRYHGEGEFRVTSGYWAKKADDAYVVGEIYPLADHHERSAKTHNHFFASIADAHSNLPDELLDQYPTPDHLRKRALVMKGYRDERSIVCKTAAEALRIAAFIKPMDDFAVVTVRDAVIRVWTAKSQSVKAMPAGEFQKSKSDVLDFIDDLLGVERGATARNEAA